MCVAVLYSKISTSLDFRIGKLRKKAVRNRMPFGHSRYSSSMWFTVAIEMSKQPLCVYRSRLDIEKEYFPFQPAQHGNGFVEAVNGICKIYAANSLKST